MKIYNVYEKAISQALRLKKEDISLRAPPPENPTRPNVGSAAVKPVQPQSASDNGQKK